MKISQSFNMHASYLNGFQDVYKHKSVSSTLLGIIKILSYATVIFPLISLNSYFKYKKIIELQKDLDNNLDKNKTELNAIKIFGEVIGNKNKQQEVLINYLANKIEYFEKNTDNEDLERKRFEKAFRKLTFDSQEKFFIQASKRNSMELALKWIPQDIEEFNFTLSHTKNYGKDQESYKQHTQTLLQTFPKFTNLKKLHLDLECLGYAHFINDGVALMTQKETASLGFSEDPMPIEQHTPFGEEFSHYLYYNSLFDTIKYLRTYIQKNRFGMEF